VADHHGTKTTIEGNIVARITLTLSVAAGLLLAAALPAFAEVTHLQIESKTTYGSFRPGDYVLWRGKIHGELAPTEAIPDIGKVRRNAHGKIEYAADIILLMPADPATGNGTLLVDVPNRGRAYGIALYNSPRGEPFESGNLGQGTGFLEDRGFSLAEIYWELGKGANLPTFNGPDGKPRYVEGVGFAIMRDAADFLAHGWADSAGTANPLRGSIDRVLASGKSQSGRFLKTFLLHGFNQMGGHRVIDGMHIFVSGAGLLPILASSPGPKSSGDAAPSFADPEFRGVNEGPFTIGEIVADVEKRGEIPPKIVMVSSTTDFLSLRASLGRTGGIGTEEQAIPPNVRMYEIAGASHVVVRHAPNCTLPPARIDWSPVSRATLVALNGWVTTNAPPPANELMPLEPTHDDDVLKAPSFLPKAVIERPKRDADGNVLGGVRLPDVAVPLGTNAAQQKPTSFACSLIGAFLPFADTKEQRETARDSRLSIAERYKNRDDYVNKIRVAARALQAEGFLLPQDAAVIIAAAAAHPWKVDSGKQ
jgi:hypothetical protein